MTYFPCPSLNGSPKGAEGKKDGIDLCLIEAKFMLLSCAQDTFFKRKLYLQQKKSFWLGVQSSIMEVAKQRQRLLATVRESIMMWKRSVKG